MPRLERQQLIRRPRHEVFAFFSDPRNLAAITPAHLQFRMVTPPPIDMRPGALIDYRLRLWGIPFTWRTRIEAFEPETRFIDTQVRGPYARWHHLHEFSDVEGGVLMRDVVDYEVGWSILGPVAHRLFVRRTLEGIFEFRRQRITELLAGELAAHPA